MDFEKVFNMINVPIILTDKKEIRYDLPSTYFRSTFLALISFCASSFFPQDILSYCKKFATELFYKTYDEGSFQRGKGTLKRTMELEKK